MFEEMKVARIDYLAGSESLSEAKSCHSARVSELRNSFPSDLDTVSPLLDQLMQFISRYRPEDANNFEIELALREALVNAIVHGNQQDPHTHVHITCRCTMDGNVSIRVEDEGKGFEHDAVPDPTTTANLLRTHGRGIYLIRTLMDEVYFERGGSVVHMHKRANGSSDTARKPQ